MGNLFNMSESKNNNDVPVREQYRALPGRAKRMFGLFVSDKQRLWLADDHILLVTQSYLTERYKRFYLNDIQAISIQHSTNGAIINVILLVLAGIMLALLLAAYSNGWSIGLQGFFGLVAGIMLLIALIHSLFGPTCDCHILTAIHEEPLYCLGRLNTARRVVEELRAAIESAQGFQAQVRNDVPSDAPRDSAQPEIAE